MAFVLSVCLVSCLSMILLILFKPKVRVFKFEISTFWLATCLGAIVLILFGSISLSEVFNGLTQKNAINPLKILVLFLSMSVLSIFLDATGFFSYLAGIVLKRAGEGQIKIFTMLYISISILTVFTSNDIIILTFTPFLCYFCKNAKINPVPYLFCEFVAANTVSILLIIGNPTNIYLATMNGITFVDYLVVMILPTLFAFIVAYFVMLLLFYRRLKDPIQKTETHERIKNKPLLIFGISVLGICTVLVAISSYINLEMWIIAFSFFVILVVGALCYGIIRHEKPVELIMTLKRIPYELVPFIISMFVLVLCLDKVNVTGELIRLLGDKSTVFMYGAVSALFANLINNIPMSVLFSVALHGFEGANILSAVYAVIIGSNIGAFFTPIGALAGIMWLRILKENDIEFGFLSFIKHGTIIAVPTLSAALFGLILIGL